MALFHMNPSYGWTPQMYQLVGSFVDPSPGTAVTNRQIPPALLTVPAANGGNIGADKQIAPLSPLAKIYNRPQGGAATPAGSENLPRGVTTTTPVAGEYLVDLSGHPGDLIAAEALLVPNVRGPAVRTAYVSAIDNVNKLIYVQVVTLATNAATAPAAGEQVIFDVMMKDAGVQP